MSFLFCDINALYVDCHSCFANAIIVLQCTDSFLSNVLMFCDINIHFYRTLLCFAI